MRFKAALRLVRTWTVLLPVMLTGCQGSPAPVTHYVGTVEGSQAFIGVVISGSDVTAYVCDGTPEAIPSMYDWFEGSLENGRFDITSRHLMHLTGTVAADGVEGSVRTREGAAFDYKAELATGSAGVFRSVIWANGTKYVAGWIRLSDGQERGAIGGDPAEAGQNLALIPIPLPELGSRTRVDTGVGTFRVARIDGQ